MFKRKRYEYNNYYYPGSFIINPTPLPAVAPEIPREVKFSPPRPQKKPKPAIKNKPPASSRPTYYNYAPQGTPCLASPQMWTPVQPPPVILAPGWPQTTPCIVPGYSLPLRQPALAPHLCTPSAYAMAELANQSSQIQAAQESTKAQIGELNKNMTELREQLTYAQMASVAPQVIAPPMVSGWTVHWDLLHCSWDVRMEASEAESFIGPKRRRKVLLEDLATALPGIERIVMHWTLPDDFPWPLRHVATSPAYWRTPEVVSTTGCKLTVHHVLNVLRNYLYEPLTVGELSAMNGWQNEWQNMSNSHAKRVGMGQCYSEGDLQRFRRIDLLGSNTRFKGFTVEEITGDSVVLTFELHDTDDD